MRSKFFRREWWGIKLVKANQFFSTPIGIIVAVGAMSLLLLLYFAADNNRIIKALKDDNARQTKLISCLLAVHGQTTQISPTEADRCRERAAAELQGGEGNVNQPSSPPTTQNSDGTVTPTQPSPQSSQQQQQQPNQSPQQPSQPNLLQQAGDAVMRTIDRALNFLDASP